MNNRLEFLLKSVRSCGPLIQSHRKQHTSIVPKTKGAISELVTDLDLAVEQKLIQALQKSFPNDQILSEESAPNLGDLNKPTWVIDPIDGTTNLVHGFPAFCVSVGFVQNNQLCLGAVYAPQIDQLFYGIRGHGSYLNNRRLKPVLTSAVNESVIGTGVSFRRLNTQGLNTQAEQVLLYIEKETRAMRRLGAAALELCYVAAGWLNGYLGFCLKPWDVAAGFLIAQEAGYHVKALPPASNDTPVPEHFICSSEVICDEILRHQ